MLGVFIAGFSGPWVNGRGYCCPLLDHVQARIPIPNLMRSDNSSLVNEGPGPDFGVLQWEDRSWSSASPSGCILFSGDSFFF